MGGWLDYEVTAAHLGLDLAMLGKRLKSFGALVAEFSLFIAQNILSRVGGAGWRWVAGWIQWK